MVNGSTVPWQRALLQEFCHATNRQTWECPYYTASHCRTRWSLSVSDKSMCTHTPSLASFPGLPCFRSSVSIDSNTRKWKSSEKWGRPERIHHMNNVRWTRGGCLGVGGIVNSGLVHVMNASRLSLFLFLFCSSASVYHSQHKRKNWKQIRDEKWFLIFDNYC